MDLTSAIKPPKPAAYWDRSQNVVRDWKTNSILPEYEGECMVYMDVSGPVFMTTFLHNGRRCWHRAGVLVSELFAGMSQRAFSE